MNGWVSWAVLWVIVMFATPERKEHRGYSWRLLRRLPPWRWVSGSSPIACTVRFVLLWIVLAIPVSLFLPEDLRGPVSYAVLIVMALDDYINGDDDDRKRRREWAKNKVKWLMQLPVPHEVRARP